MKDAALDVLWQKPIRRDQLQAEVDRMAKSTQDPLLLGELFGALGNDPFLIAECLARPVLADRLIRDWYAFDVRFHADAREEARRAAEHVTLRSFSTWPEGRHRRIRYVPAGTGFSRPRPVDGKSAAVAEIPLGPDEWRDQLQAAGEAGLISPVLEDAGCFRISLTRSISPDLIEMETLRFDKMPFDRWWRSTREELAAPTSIGHPVDGAYRLPEIDREEDGTCEGLWRASILYGAPDARDEHTAVWTGTEMIVWGGMGDYPTYKASGARYDPATDTWIPTSMGSSCPTERCVHSAVWTGEEMIVWGGTDDSNLLSTGARYDPASDTWTTTSTNPPCPTARAGHTAVWTGTEMVVWGGFDGGYANTGGRYDPASDSWVALSTDADCPSGRYYHTAVWSGAEMIVWGGFGSDSTFLGDGARYDPGTDAWAATPTGTGCPSARRYHSAVWTGTEMIIWGGYDGGSLNTGGRYDPAADAWAATSTDSNCPSNRDRHGAVWTGTEMIVWGGTSSSVGGRYDPATDTWLVTSTGTGCPSGRDGLSAVWTGTEMIVWGGALGATQLNSGGRYDPAADTWIATPVDTGGPSGRRYHSCVWTGAELIVWGGEDSDYTNTGGRYDPAIDSWTATSTGAGCPPGRIWHSAVWTGTEMIVWGGFIGTQYFDTGGRYDPAADAWTATSTAGDCPSDRYGHSAVWTGTEMVVWGGWDGSYTNTGARYDPTADGWTPTSGDAGRPSGRFLHSAVWTGEEMIVWGGYDGGYLNTGGRYDPGGDAWTACSTGAGCPQGRQYHSSVWTGSEMIVWGGHRFIGSDDYLNSGGKYDPASDAWAETSTASGCPSERRDHTAVWTGSAMLVWGGYGANPFYFGNGAWYDPSADAWGELASGSFSPAARRRHAAAWTGEEMIVWGGEANGFLDSGGVYRYAPQPVIAGDAEVCSGESALLTGSGPFHTYQWVLDGIDIPGATDSVFLASQEGSYTLRAGDEYGCHWTSDAHPLSLLPVPTPTVSGDSENLCPETSVLLLTEAEASIQWLLDGTPIPGATGTTYEATLSGGFSVTAANGVGCEATSADHPVLVTFCATSEVSPPQAVFPFRLYKMEVRRGASHPNASSVLLSFQKVGAASGYNIYEGGLGDWYSHGGSPGNLCDEEVSDLGTGEMQSEITAAEGNRYYLVTAFSSSEEGPSGFDSSGSEIPPAQSTCAP